MDFFENAIQSELTKTGAFVAAYFVSEKHPNTFPALPVRETANAFVWFSVFPDEMAYERHAAALADSIRLEEKKITKGLTARLKERPEILRLLPTPRSRLHAIDWPKCGRGLCAPTFARPGAGHRSASHVIAGPRSPSARSRSESARRRLRPSSASDSACRARQSIPDKCG